MILKSRFCMNSLKIGVIIVLYNSRKYLDDLFFSLAKVEYPNWEIVCVDNGSQDGGAEYLKEKFAGEFSNLTIMKIDKNSGFAIGNNIGLKYLEENNFDYAYLLNQDTAVAHDFLEKALEKADDAVGSVQSLIYIYPTTGNQTIGNQVSIGYLVPNSPPSVPGSPDSFFNKINTCGNAVHYLGFGYCYGYGWNREKWEKYLADWKKRDAELNIAYGSGAGLLLNMRALRETGFFDDMYFMYHEDLDLGWRLRLAGYKNILAPESIIYHKYEFSKSIKKYYWMERNRIITIFKNYSAWSLALILPPLFIMEAGMFFFSFFSGWWREKLRVYEYFLIPKHWRRIAAERRKIQKSRKVSDCEILKYFVGKILFQDIDNWVLRKIANPLFELYWRVIRKLFLC